ncbi:hypothetical protein K501DRAFT_217151 [Backusella circina FSU 941]|nr:hypothetical protein K501DRAFT_217151 [Backusella circina FSU 941]
MTTSMSGEGSSSSKYIPTERTQLVSESSKYPERVYGTDNNTTPQERREPSNCRYILPSTIFLIIVLTLLLLGWLPSFAERTVDQAIDFQFQQASILNVSDDNQVTLHVMGQMELKQDLYHWTQRINSVFGKIITAPTELKVEYDNEIMAANIGLVALPELTLNSSSPVTRFDFITTFLIQDTQALMLFCKQAVVAKTVMWHLSGILPLSLGWLPYKPNVDLDRSIVLQAMDGLKQTDLHNMAFIGEHPLGGLEVQGTVGLFNPSNVLSLNLGDIDLGIHLPYDNDSTKDVQIAVVRAHNADLKGNSMNYFNVTGRTLPLDEQDETTQDILSGFLSRYIHGNSSIVHIRASKTGPDVEAVSLPDWIKDALTSVTLAIPFPGASETDLIKSLELTNIQIESSRMGNILLTADALAYLKKPREMQFDLDVTEIDPHVYVYLNENSPKPFSVIHPSKPCPAQTENIEQLVKVTSHITKAPLQVLPGGQSDFEKFVNRILSRQKPKVYYRGKADIKVNGPFGHLFIHDLEFNGELQT